MEVGCWVHAPAILQPEKKTIGHCIGDWVGSRTGLNVLAKTEILIAARNPNPGRPIRIAVTTPTEKLTVAQLLINCPRFMERHLHISHFCISNTVTLEHAVA
jgi:hypothetical protein